MGLIAGVLGLATGGARGGYIVSVIGAALCSPGRDQSSWRSSGAHGQPNPRRRWAFVQVSSGPRLCLLGECPHLVRSRR